MKLEQLVKAAQVEVSEAKKAVKDGAYSIAKACLLHLRDLIEANVK